MFLLFSWKTADFEMVRTSSAPQRRLSLFRIEVLDYVQPLRIIVLQTVTK